MPLNLNDTALQIESMVSLLIKQKEGHEFRLNNAVRALKSFSLDDYESIKKKEGNFSDIPSILEPPTTVYNPQSIPNDFTIVAVDGSHIDVDRHLPARCYLINIGSATLTYGSQSDASLENSARLYSHPDEIAIVDPNSNNSQNIEGAVLGAKRTVAEMIELVNIIKDLPENLPVLALVDGPLVMIGLTGQGYGDFVREDLIENGFVKAITELRELSQKRPLALAGYVSLPRYSEVVNTLVIGNCKYPKEERRCSTRPGTPIDQCSVCVGGIQDRELFAKLLSVNQRSARFSSSSRIVKNHYSDTEIDFFYLNVGYEIARIEIPSWTSRKQSSLELVHSLIVDQAKRGKGYPISLMEAHEMAAIQGSDRRHFTEMVERTLNSHNMPVFTSEKARSKRLRWL